MSKGLRFNAKKDKAPEKYFTTQIWCFSMKCPEIKCDQNMVIKTDPENRTYEMAEGMRKMEQEFEPEANDSIIKATTDEERDLLATDPMYRLQHDKEDKRRALSAKEHLESLIDLQDSQKERDYDMNCLLRKGSREKRKRAIFLLEEGKARGLNIPLVEENESDATNAKAIKFNSKINNSFAVAERSKMTALQSQSIFAGTKKMKRDSSSKIQLQQKGTKKRLPKATDISSEAKNQQMISMAMAKQAVVNINTKKLKICDQSSSSLCDEKNSKPLQIRFASTALSTVPFDKNHLICDSKKDYGALSILSQYCDDDNDSV
jgi:coiled-coil domain-containing protein 130